MDVFWTKIICAALAVVLSLLFGFLPLTLKGGKCSINIDPAHPDYKSHRKGNQILAFLLNFAGGVLLANCFCHWLPEVVEGIEHADLETELPVAEIIMMCGFFLVCFLEELIHALLHRHTPQGQKEREDNKNNLEKKKKKGTNKVSPQDVVTVNGACDDEKKCRKLDLESSSEEEQDAMLDSDSGDFDLTISAIRTFFVVFALSFHSVIEGLALALEEESSGVWLNFGALAMHKFVIAFAVGIELIAVQASKVNYYVSIVVFSLAPALGVTIGMILTRDSGEGNVDNLALQILQAIATGTIIYVVFFEIFPMARKIGGSGFRTVLAMTIGFAAFIPSLFFHTHDDEDEEHSH